VHRVVAGASHEMLVADQTASASTIAAIAQPHRSGRLSIVDELLVLD